MEKVGAFRKHCVAKLVSDLRAVLGEGWRVRGSVLSKQASLDVTWHLKVLWDQENADTYPLANVEVSAYSASIGQMLPLDFPTNSWDSAPIRVRLRSLLPRGLDDWWAIRDLNDLRSASAEITSIVNEFAVPFLSPFVTSESMVGFLRNPWGNQLPNTYCEWLADVIEKKAPPNQRPWAKQS